MFWELIKTDGEVKYVPPHFADQIKREMQSGQTHLNSFEPILIRHIKDFRESERPYIEQARQLSAGELTVAQSALGTPVLVGDAVKAIAVKKRVPTRRIEYYHKSGYRLLEEGDNGAWFGYWIPAHMYDSKRHQRATRDEAKLIP